MINWYRGLLKRSFTQPAAGSITPPVEIIWGRRDAYAIPELAEQSAALCANARVHFLNDATHWPQRDTPGRVNELLLAFLAEA
jgi:pimeloyl-ACP methyl ester carboxylesterase